MTSNYRINDPNGAGDIDLDEEYITDAWLIDKYVGQKLWSWGINGSGQLGNNNRTSYSTPVSVGALTTWKQVGLVGSIYMGAIKTDGTLWMWGNNQYGQLGTGGVNEYSSPVQIGALTNWKQLALSHDAYSAAVKTDGTLWAWGYNNYGQLGIGNTAYYSSPVQVGALTNWKFVSLGGLDGTGANHTLSLKTDGTLWSWGVNRYGQLGYIVGQSALNDQYVSSPIQVGSLTNWNQISANGWSSFAIKTDGTLWSWGYNNYGQLGLSDTNHRSSPVQVGSLNNWRTIASAGTSALAIKTDGTLWAWGENSYGQLGLGDRTHRSSPTQVGSLTNWKQVSGMLNGIAVKTDGTLWGWGKNENGQLGLNNQTYYSSPVQIGSLTSWKYATGNWYGTWAVQYKEE